MKGTGQRLYQRAKERIPGGTQLLSKRPEMFLPDQWPAYYDRAKGAEVWDLDGRRYIDMGYSAMGACPLGFADPDVDEAVKRAIDRGTASTLNAPEEVELADLLCELHPWAEMVRFARTGGEAMAIAVRIARAATGRDVIAFCGYHGWHDWYLAANLADDDALDGHLLPGLAPAGVPRALLGTSLPFEYDRLDQLQRIAASEGPRLAAVVMEPIRSRPPTPGFLQAVADVTRRSGAALIFDEVTSGFRMNTGGIHLLGPVRPDIAVFAKAMANGYPMAAIVGRRSVMEAAQSTFISSTNWTERIGPTAALATIRKHRELDVGTHQVRIGARVKRAWIESAATNEITVEVTGIDPLGHLEIRCMDADEAHTLFTQVMLEQGYLAGKGFYATYAHTDAMVDAYAEAMSRAFAEIRAAISTGGLGARLKGPPAHRGFRRLV